ncbi:GTPase activating factor [Oleoguttula sp. CCFEE 5521]
MSTPSGQARRHWEESRPRKKEPTLYDEWLAEEKATKAAQKEAEVAAKQQSEVHRAQVQSSLGLGDTASVKSSGVRTITPDASEPGTERGTTSFERAFIPTSTTTIVGGPAAYANTGSPSGSSLSARFRRDRDWDSGTTNSRSSPSSRNGVVNGKGMLARTSSKSNGEPPPTSAPRAHQPVRPRTRTLEERRSGDHSPGTLRHRHRIGSINTPQSPISNDGADFLASVPAATSPPSAPSISSLGSPAITPAEYNRSISPISSQTSDTTPGALPSASTRRILHLMKTLNGKMSGNAQFRSSHTSKWRTSYCYITEGSGSLMYELRGNGGDGAMLVPDLRGCKVTLAMDAETPYINVDVPHTNSEIQLKLSNQPDFDAWFAALLCWQPLEPRESRKARPQPIAMPMQARPEPPARVSSARSSSANGQETRDRANSSKSNRRKSVFMTPLKENPVIKIGKMIYWDTNMTYNNTPTSMLGQSAAGRPQPNRMQSFASRRWRRISGQLRENGELKLHSDSDNSLISVVQLSQLSRCAIQRLDSSVLDNEYCIAIYPQYTSSQTSNASLLRPIFLSLENRVLYEVWFVLLRAFTIPALYGPRPSSDDTDSQNVGDMMGMFRMERSLHIRVVEAKMYPPTSGIAAPESGFSGGHGKGSQVRPEQHGYHVEVLLDDETRGKTAVKYEGLNPLWGETFEFLDLPPVLSSASVAIKRRPPDHLRTSEQHQSKLVHEAYGLSKERDGYREGGYTGINFDTTCGKVEIFLEELAAANEVEKWWPAYDSYGQRVGEILIKARAEEGVILMARDYKPLSDLLHRFSNGLTLQIAQIIPTELKRLSDYLLNIFQVSGYASDWIMALIEEEIDSIHKETPMNRLQYTTRRAGSNASDNIGLAASSHTDRELLVRDMNKNATLEANLLFRGNTLLTKSLDSHMRRIGREYLEEALGAEIRKINDSDPDCEVDPNRVASTGELDRNWRRLNQFTQAIWKSIMASRAKCPIELRRIFRHVRACAEDRYGDFLRSVSYSSVSGFLFLRFFCPAVLNPKLFGLLKDDIKPRARRTCTLIAKSLQTLANMASFGTKEHWMEPMNSFLTQHRESFKSFIDDVCYVPSPLTAKTNFSSTATTTPSPTSPTHHTIADTHLSYTTPMTIMHRLPPTSREGFPSLPYLIDQARAFAELIQLWLETTAQSNDAHEAGTTGKPNISLLQELQSKHAADSDLRTFHDVCTHLYARTQECLSRAERAERPNSALSFRWDELIDQLEKPDTDDEATPGYSRIADRIAANPSIVPPPQLERLVAQLQPPATLREADEEDDEDVDQGNATRMYESTPPHSRESIAYEQQSYVPRSDGTRSAANTTSVPNSLRRTPNLPLARNGRVSTDSPSASASASASNVSSAVSSDAEVSTALPRYERGQAGRVGGGGFLHHRSEKHGREDERKEEKRREKEKEREREKEREKEKRKGKALLQPLRKRRD